MKTLSEAQVEDGGLKYYITYREQHSYAPVFIEGAQSAVGCTTIRDLMALLRAHK